MTVTFDPKDVPHIFAAIFLYLMGLRDREQTIYNASLASKSMRNAGRPSSLPRYRLQVSARPARTVEVVCAAENLNTGRPSPSHPSARTVSWR